MDWTILGLGLAGLALIIGDTARAGRRCRCGAQKAAGARMCVDCARRRS